VLFFLQLTSHRSFDRLGAVCRRTADASCWLSPLCTSVRVRMICICVAWRLVGLLVHGGSLVCGSGWFSAAAWISFLSLVYVAFPPCTCYPANLQATPLHCVRTVRPCVSRLPSNQSPSCRHIKLRGHITVYEGVRHSLLSMASAFSP